jgi:hypothetical protein
MRNVVLDDLPDAAITMIRVMRRRGYRVRVREGDGIRQVDVRHDWDCCPDALLELLCQLTGAQVATSSRPKED